jgi:NADPH-dependent F420 reductase
MTDKNTTIAVIGGTGQLGSGLALRLARAGYPVVIGSRSAEKGEAVARELAGRAGAGAKISGFDNRQAAAHGGIIIMTVPFASHDATCDEIAPETAGKILVDATVPLMPPKVARVQLPAAGSAALTTRAKCPAAQVVSAFQNVAAHKLAEDQPIECDILVCGDKVEARARIIALIEAIGLRGIHAGPLDNAVVAEALTSILIGINKRYKVDGAGIRITGELQFPEGA